MRGDSQQLKKRVILGFFALFLLFGQNAALAQNARLDTFLQEKLSHRQFAAVRAQKLASERATKSSQMPAEKSLLVFIKTTDLEASTEGVTDAGGVVRVTIGDSLFTAEVSLSALASLSERDEIVYIEAGSNMNSFDIVANAEINAEQVQTGNVLKTPFTGTGVIVGVVDTGIDFHHEDFNDDLGNTRIISIWDQRAAGGNTPRELVRSYGRECLADEIERDACPLIDDVGHGTHVAGIAAANSDEYNGVAPDANIVMVRFNAQKEQSNGYATPLYSTNICEAISYIFAKADALGKPAVVNLSLGSHLGAHDGSSLFEQCIDSLVADKPGRALVAAAGNEHPTQTGDTGIHTRLNLNNNALASNFHISKKVNDQFYYIDAWATTGSDFTLRLALHNGSLSSTSLQEVTEEIRIGEKREGSFDNGRIRFQVNASQLVHPLNQKVHIGISLYLSEQITDFNQYSFDLIAKGHGQIDAWLYPDAPADSISFTNKNGKVGNVDWTYVSGDKQMSIAIPATAKNVIAVGAYSSRTNWITRSNEKKAIRETFGSILSFSSRGPSANESEIGMKPEITAPGAMIASALSKDANIDEVFITEDGKHSLQAGTSMAAPFVSGAIALLFEANPELSFQDVEEAIVKSAYQDEEVGAVPNATWGYGKLDVLKAVEIASNITPSQNGIVPLSDGSNGSCSLVTNTPQTIFPSLLFISLFVPLIVVRKSFSV